MIRLNRGEDVAVGATTDDIENPVDHSDTRRMSTTGHRRPRFPGVRGWIIGLEGCQSATGVILAAGSIENPVDHSDTRHTSRSGHRRLRRPRVRSGIIGLDRPQVAVVAVVPAHSIENAVDYRST